MLSRASRTEAVQYLELAKQAQHPVNDAVQIGFQCPKENVPCKTIEFDNIKVFYHTTWPENIPSHFLAGTSTSVAQASASQCIDWAAEGIKIEAFGQDGEWGRCLGLVVPPDTRVRITYPFCDEQRTHEIVFPTMDPVPTIYLDQM